MAGPETDQDDKTEAPTQRRLDKARAQGQAPVSQELAGFAGLLGGTLAATSHMAKATTRAAVNTSPEPFSNIGLSLLGDAAVPTMLWLAWEHPLWALAGVAAAVLVMAALIVLLAKFLRGLLGRLRRAAA